MASGIYTAASGARSRDEAMAVVANNLANARTPGFKGQSPLFREVLASVTGLGDPRQAMGVHTPVRFLPRDRIATTTEGLFTRFSQGSLRETGNPLDLAVAGEGFFALQGERGIRLTRNGTFRLEADGTLVTAAGGLPVLDQGGRPIRLPETPDRASVQIGADGSVRIGESQIGQIALVQVRDARRLKREGESRFVPSGRPVIVDSEGRMTSYPDGRPVAGQPPGATGRVEQGFLEQANVNPIMTMSLLIKTHRLFELNTKAIEAYRDMDLQAAREVGRLR